MRKLVGLVLGAVIGALLRPAPVAESPPPLPPLQAAAGPALCVATPSAAMDCSEQTVALGSCRTRLAELSAPRAGLDLDFATVEDHEQPEAWTTRFDALVEDCDLDAQLLAVDCSAYPCVAVLRPGKGQTGTALQEHVEDACEPEEDTLPVLVNVPVHCPDGSEQRLTAAALVDFDALTTQVRTAENQDQEGLLIAHVGRRMARLPELWPCEGPP